MCHYYYYYLNLRIKIRIYGPSCCYLELDLVNSNSIKCFYPKAKLDVKIKIFMSRKNVNYIYKIKR